MSSFIVRPLDPVHTAAAQSRLAEADASVRLVEVSSATGFPCRVTLQWAQPGESVLLFRHRPFGPVSPYAEEGPVFARRDGEPASLAPDQLPDYVADIAHVAVRGYDATTSIAHAEIVAGADCAAAIGRAFGKDEIEYVHVRAGAYGCFQFRVDRAA